MQFDVGMVGEEVGNPLGLVRGTCLPARSAARAIVEWLWMGVAKTTASTSLAKSVKWSV